LIIEVLGPPFLWTFFSCSHQGNCFKIGVILSFFILISDTIICKTCKIKGFTNLKLYIAHCKVVHKQRILAWIIQKIFDSLEIQCANFYLIVFWNKVMEMKYILFWEVCICIQFKSFYILFSEVYSHILIKRFSA